MAEPISHLIRRMNETSRRLRDLEIRLERFESSILNLEDKILTQMEELKLSFERILKRITKLVERVEINDKEVERLKNRFVELATKNELKQLETFIDLLNPIKSSFVTKGELEKRLDLLKEEILRK